MKILKKICDYFFIGFSFLFSKKIVAVLTVYLFISLLDISLGYKEALLEKELEMIYEKKVPNITYYQEKVDTMEEVENSAISDLISCYQLEIDLEKENIETKEYINQLEKLYQENSKYFAFFYQDLFSGFTVSYNEDAPIFTASTIKAPAMIYLYEMASQGRIDLTERLTYTGNFYNGGSGVLKSKPVNTTYTIEELIQYAIHDSDNIAYTMLMNRFPRQEILNFWNGLGTKNIYTLDTIWGVTSARDASIYMKELYRFSKTNTDYGKRLLQYFLNAEWKLITNKEGEFQTANKGGWSGQAIHDVAIVFDKNPYILVIMSNTGEENYNYLFQNTSRLVGQLHESYWKYKEAKCNTIKQY